MSRRRAAAIGYDMMYRYWAPWDGVGVRAELRAVVEEGIVSPETHPRALDLGCGTGANAVYLAQRGFESWGVDFSRVALDRARRRARAAGVIGRIRFVEGDLTGGEIPGLEKPFDFLVDFSTLDDLRPPGRRAIADLIVRLSRPGSVLLLWGFYGRRSELPLFSLHGPSRIGGPILEPGEEMRLFGDHFEIRPGPQPQTTNPAACFVLVRKP